MTNNETAYDVPAEAALAYIRSNHFETDHDQWATDRISIVGIEMFYGECRDVGGPLRGGRRAVAGTPATAAAAAVVASRGVPLGGVCRRGGGDTGHGAVGVGGGPGVGVAH